MTPTICHCPSCDGETRVESECVAVSDAPRIRCACHRIGTDNASDIVWSAILAAGFDGLYNEVMDCACDNDDREPCGALNGDCRPGYKAPCDCGDHDWHIEKERR